MANVLSEEKRQQVIALGRLGWSLRRIEAEAGVRRETASAYLKEAGIKVRSPGRWGRTAKPANEVTTDPSSGAAPGGEAKPANKVTTDSGFPPVVGQNSIQRLIDRRVARSASPMMDLLGRRPALQPQR
jgi:hypothetical protein